VRESPKNPFSFGRRKGLWSISAAVRIGVFLMFLVGCFAAEIEESAPAGMVIESA